jgi:hypothetical protein
LNTLLPVIANSEESLPSNLSASFANNAIEALTAFDVVPLIVAFIVPSTVKSPFMCAEPDTERDPVINGSNIFI